jgi:hypothetical protein
MRVDELAERGRPAAGDELSEGDAGVAAARGDRTSRSEGGLFFPGGAQGRGSAAGGCGGMRAGGVGRGGGRPGAVAGAFAVVAGADGRASLLGQRAVVRGAVAVFGAQFAAGMAWRSELQRLRAAGGEPRPVDRLDGGGARAEFEPGGEQQPVSDRADGAGEVPGLARAGALRGAVGGRLGGGLRLPSGSAGDLRGAGPLRGHLLPCGQLEVCWDDFGPGPAGDGCDRQRRISQAHGGVVAGGAVPAAGRDGGDSVGAGEGRSAGLGRGRTGGRGHGRSATERRWIGGPFCGRTTRPPRNA